MIRVSCRPQRASADWEQDFNINFLFRFLHSFFFSKFLHKFGVNTRTLEWRTSVGCLVLLISIFGVVDVVYCVHQSALCGSHYSQQFSRGSVRTAWQGVSEVGVGVCLLEVSAVSTLFRVRWLAHLMTWVTGDLLTWWPGWLVASDWLTWWLGWLVTSSPGD